MATVTSESPPPPITSFSSLPDDVALYILARLSRIYYPSLSLVSKRFQSLLSSRELYSTRTLIRKTENCVYLCLQLSRDKYKHRWYTTGQKKLIAIPPFPYKHPESPTIVPTGSEIYMIGGFIKEESRCRSSNVFVLNCRSHQWSRFPNMLFPRGNASASLIQGKIYVFGGCETPCNENWGEIYDPKNKSWELLSPTTLITPDLEFQKSVEETCTCFVGEEKIWCRGLNGYLNWCDLKDNLGWRAVKGLSRIPKLYRLLSVANSDGGKRVTICGVRDYSYFTLSEESYIHCKTDIWCAEISLERPSREELFGVVKWCKRICTMNRIELGEKSLLLCSATVKH